MKKYCFIDLFDINELVISIPLRFKCSKLQKHVVSIFATLTNKNCRNTIKIFIIVSYVAINVSTFTIIPCLVRDATGSKDIIGTHYQNNHY